MKSFSSAIGNNQFVATPFHITRMPLCDYIDGNFYRTLIHPDYEHYTDIPRLVADKPLCPLYKKVSNAFKII